jgi:hypothetical protein
MFTCGAWRGIWKRRRRGREFNKFRSFEFQRQSQSREPGASNIGLPSAGTQVIGNGSSFATQSKPAIDVRDYGVDCTGGSASDSGLSSAATAGPHAVIPQGCVVRLSTSKSHALALEFKQGGQLKPDTGVTVTLTGNLIAGRQQIFANALPGQGTIDFTGNVGVTEVYPEWWGASSSATAAVNTPAFQAAEYGAFGTNRLNGSGLSQWNKRLAGKFSFTTCSDSRFAVAGNSRAGLCRRRRTKGLSTDRILPTERSTI